MSARQQQAGEQVGLLGVGLVGEALAGNLIEHGYRVVGFDPLPERREALRRLGGTPAESAREVGRQARRVLVSVFDTQTVIHALEGPAGLLEAREPPAFVLDTTTGDPEATAALAARLRGRGVRFLDATVSGSSQQVRRREAVFMVGGEAEDVESCRDLLQACGPRFFHIGAPGNGSRAKLASNLVLGLNRLVLAEGLVFAERLGLEPRSFLEVLKASPAYSRAMDVKGEKMLAADFTPQSRIRQHHKDLSIILRYAEQAGQELPLARLHARLLEEAMAAGEGELDNAAVIQAIRRLGGPR